MAKKSGLASKSTPNALTRVSIFGEPPLLGDEDPANYQKFLARVSKDIRPTDVLEEIWIRDIVDLSWEALRWRRLIASLLKAQGIHNCIDHVERINKLAMAAEARRNAALREIDRHRATFAQNLRQSIQKTVDAEFEVVESPRKKAA